MSNSTYCFVDSSNLFYGGIRRLGWKIDYEKLSIYLKRKYQVKKIFYYTGVETHGYEVDTKSTKSYLISSLLKYLLKLLKECKNEKEKELLEKDIARAKFLRKIKTFGYILRLKPIKHIKSYDGSVKSKANCDVDLTFDLVRLEKEYDRVLLLSGDGDFEILLRYLLEEKKDFIVIANTENTARAIKSNYKERFLDFSRMREIIENKNGEIVQKGGFPRGLVSK